MTVKRDDYRPSKTAHARTRISIISPSLNQHQYIDAAIRSVALQRSRVAEHIVVDGLSTDPTLEYLEALDHRPGLEHVRWVSEPDDGQSDAINKGFWMARGDVVAWLNTDDYYLPGALDLVAEAFDNNPGVDVLYGEAQFVDAKGRLIRVKRDHAFDREILLYYGCYIMSTSTFIRKRVIDSGEFLDPTFRVTMDFEYYARLSGLGYRFGFLPRPLAAFRWHESNVSSLNSATRLTERRRVQLQHCGLRWLGGDGVRGTVIASLEPIYRAKPCEA